MDLTGIVNLQPQTIAEKTRQKNDGQKKRNEKSIETGKTENACQCRR